MELMRIGETNWIIRKAVELANEIIGKDIISKLHFCNENLEI